MNDPREPKNPEIKEPDISPEIEPDMPEEDPYTPSKEPEIQPDDEPEFPEDPTPEPEIPADLPSEIPPRIVN
ncbi:hypothetical protein I5907_20435 [Panacibacter sp. DH6]|uniref:Uncharacterized protein n=1 Tax=Panacibacter microcysteis TaxID=2793269 RepID=A0A931H0A9_9BACT|nr:hypothetical protein [Panacibacter microcysteis]MBG9378612.1 hypothetical protein [Panacibacter microcysteis]